MTREEFYREYPEFNHIRSPTSIMEQIVTDEFESRTCENCKWYYEPRVNCSYGYCKILSKDDELRIDDSDFGCNKFEAKEDD